MSKSSSKLEKSEMYSGKKDGITFEKFDELMLSWGRKKFGDKYATLLWKDELYDLNKVDLTDELEKYDYEIHCTLVYDVMCYDSAKYADGIFNTERFWTVQYQIQARQRFRERMYCYLETVVKGEAARQVKKQGVRKMAGMRDFLFKRFGAGQPEILEERIRKYHLGMPDKNGEAFPPRCDMEAKLDELEAEREHLIEMCPKELRDNYEDGKESTLTRIVLRHRPKEYDAAVKTVMDLHRFRLYGKDWDVSKITNLEDNSRVLYNVDWLPNYEELRAELISSYQLQKRRREEENKSVKKSPGHPVLAVLQGFDQPGPSQKTCYGCGERGHFKGDPACTAAPNAVWSGAPEGFKLKAKNGGKGKGTRGQSNKGKGKGRGSAKGGNRQRNERVNQIDKKTPCKFFNSGNGYCKWGDNCRHSHEKSKGGKRKPSLLVSKKDKKTKKEIAAMVISDLKANLKHEKFESADSDGDDNLYNLVRGHKTAMMIHKGPGGEDFVPKRRVIMVVSSNSEDEEYTPVKPNENSEDENKNKNKTKISESPVNQIDFSENPPNLVLGNQSSFISPPKTKEKNEMDWEKARKHLAQEGKRAASPSSFLTSSDSDSATESSSNSSSSSDKNQASPNTKRVKKARKSSDKRAKKRAKRDEQQISTEHEMEKIGLALQQQHHLMRSTLEAQNNRLLHQQETIEEISRMLSETKEKEDKQRESVKKAAQREKQHITKAYEKGYHQRPHDKSLSVHENIARSKAQSKERKEAYWGIEDHRELTIVRRDLNLKHKLEDQLAALNASAACQPNMSNRARRKLRQSRQQRRDKAMGAIHSPGEKRNKSTFEKESALQKRRVALPRKGQTPKDSALHERRDERLRLQDENFQLVSEIRKLETRRAERWRELIALNEWDNHENDAVVKEIDYELKDLNLKQLKVWTLFQESNERWDRFMRMVETEVPPPPQKQTEEEGLEDEELDHLFLLKVKKGENKMFVQFLLNEDKAGWEGPFVLDMKVTRLIQHDNQVHPLNGKWELKSQKEQSSSSETNKGQPYSGFSKGVRGDGFKKVSLQDILEAERRRKEQIELKFYRDKMILEKEMKEREDLITQRSPSPKSPKGFTDSPPRASAFSGVANPLAGLQKDDAEAVIKAAESLMFSPQNKVKGKEVPELKVPRFTMGQRVYYYTREIGNEKWHSARVIGITYPGEGNHSIESEHICYRLLPDREEGQTYDIVNRMENSLRDWSWAKPCMVTTKGIQPKKKGKSKPTPLVPLDLVGIDTCSALSVSSRAEDFMWVDSSHEARKSVVLRGVGGDSAKIGGRGPMVVLSKDKDGNEILIYDPAAVYLQEGEDQADFRIFGQQRLKAFGFNLWQRSEIQGGDILCYNNGQRIVPLITDSGILALQTYPRLLSTDQIADVENTIDQSLGGGDGIEHCIQVSTSLIMNEAYLSEVEAARLLHWRIGHRSLGKSILNENCPVCTEAKKKTGTFKRNYEFVGSTNGDPQPYFRLYVDGYGGLNSMGDMSYQGGIGGFVFACPLGSIKTKLYGTTEQFPSIMFQVLQEIESEGYFTREIYVDTHSVNLSRAAEEVAAMFRVRIIPVSAGTPQEMAYAESAVRVIGQMGRTLMCGAPHLPAYCWGLADLYASYIHDLIPHSRIKMSPFEYRTGREPDLELFFVKVFGAPCQYAPIEGADHKRGRKTEWGWFVGMQSPMCLVLRPDDDKILSVSRKKIHVHEECYAKFDPAGDELPLASFAIPTINLDEEKTAVENLERIIEYKDKLKIPDHVLSIKSLSDHNRHPELNDPIPPTLPSASMNLIHQPTDPGEKTQVYVPEHEIWNKDLLLDKIKELRKLVNIRRDKGGRVEAILKALKRAEEEANNEAARKNTIKKKVKFKSVDVVKSNILRGPRKRAGPSESGGAADTNGDIGTSKKKKVEVGSRVKIKTSAFGKSYAEGLPEFTYGLVRTKKGDIFNVLWDAGDSMNTHKRHLTVVNDGEASECEDEPRYNSRLTKETILPILSVGAALSQPNPNGKDNWPRDFYEALLRDDWRDWVQAVKNETDSWSMLEASTEIPYTQMERGASIIPLGELFSVKRNGKYKFRQYALGNMLKEGKDYGETFSSTVSGDGVRWFCSLACSCKKEIRGWDATTGYLQTQQRVTVYAYLPSHHGYSDLSFEQLAPLRKQLKDMESAEGIKSVKDFARKIKRERRERPKTVLRLNKSVYGIPDAGQSFSMFMQALHLKHCNMVQSEMDPCVFYKIMETAENKVASYLIVIMWVDDCRFFGTSDLVKEYEQTVSKNCKCTLEGVSREFVSIQINHKVEEGILELTQHDYWIKAVERFKDFLPPNGPKERKIPLSPADEKLLVEPSEQEMKAAEHLPYASLLGVCQYPSSFTKLEMRYSMSVLSRHRTKWGLDHFKILVKAFEYGYSTRHLGLKYNGNLPTDEANVLVGFADSSLTIPRSQGCRSVVMNDAAISMTSKKHTTTDDSTTASELTELHLCACDVVGFRELMKEIGLEQVRPTVIWQDNQAAIQVAMNRGSLSKKTRAMEVRVFSVRNKIEDMKVEPIYLKTENMLADIGTKALDPSLFISLRDQLCGYKKIIARKMKGN